MDSINALIEIFSEFPGIGPRQAKRFAYFLLTRNKSYIDNFIKNVEELKKEIAVCSSCFRFFSSPKTKINVCNICSDKNRDSSVLLVVCRDVDFENVEKSHSYNGKYFVLGGSVPILEKNPDQKIRAKELLKQVENAAKENGLKEIIIAVNANPEGENTHYYVSKLLEPLLKKHSVKISTLGRGLSTGTELEYSDSDTIKNALSNRKEEK